MWPILHFGASFPEVSILSSMYKLYSTMSTVPLPIRLVLHVLHTFFSCGMNSVAEPSLFCKYRQYCTNTVIQYKHCCIVQILQYSTNTVIQYTYCISLQTLLYSTNTAIQYKHCCIVQILHYSTNTVLQYK